jgi:hypothetical protein
MSRAALALVLVPCALVPAAAGAGAQPPIALTASPARVSLTGSGSATIRVTNTGRRAVVLDVGRAGFALDLRGRPRVVARGGARTADGWLTVRPTRLRLAARAVGALTVRAVVPRRAEPGDHDALVMLTTRPERSAGLGVRMRIGVVVVVRAPGRIVRGLAIRGLTVRRAGRTRSLELLVANRGNVTESLGRAQVVVALRRDGLVRARLRPGTRQLRPRTSGIVQLGYRGQLHGWVTAIATVRTERTVLRRSFRLRL